MTHEVFGRIKYRERAEQWVGHAPLPRFARLGDRAPEQPLSEEDADRMLGEMNAAMDNMRSLMRERFGDRADAVFDELERESQDLENAPELPEADPEPVDEEREQKRAERARKRTARLAKGQFPFGITAPPGSEPRPAQEATFRFLTANEEAVLDAVVAQVWDSFQNAYSQEHWRQIAGIKPAATVADLAGRFGITRADLTRESRGGFAHLVFPIESDWQDEHGLMVVYSPDTRESAWATWDGLDEYLESDDPADAGEEYVPTPHDELLEAILTGDDLKARELIAAGADINDLGEEEYPPLWISVDQMEVEEVRRLLAFGADPSIPNPDENTTPLKHAKKLYRDMGFAPSKKRDPLLSSILDLAASAPGNQFAEIKQRLQEIIRLLEAAVQGGNRGTP